MSFDPTDPNFVQNPYPAYQEMRAVGDMVYWDAYDMPVAVTAEAVKKAMRHPNMGRAVPKKYVNTPEALRPFNEVEAYSLLELEPPDHTRIRRVVASAFVLDRMAVLTPLVSQIADALINKFPDDAPFDLLTAFAQPLTARTIAAFLGIDTEHAPQMQAWSDAMVTMYQTGRNAAVEHAAASAANDFSTFITAELDRRKSFPLDDFLTELTLAESAGTLTRAEAVSSAILLLNAGQEATAHAIANAIRTLLDFPETALAVHPTHCAGTVEECLRFTPPLHMFTRQVYKPVSFMGVDFKEGSEIGCLLGSACRDDAVWPDGDIFDPFRLRRPHQAFGVGIHACTGAALARLEMHIALPALFSRCLGMTLASPPRIADTYHFHGLESLEVKLAGPTLI